MGTKRNRELEAFLALTPVAPEQDVVAIWDKLDTAMHANADQASDRFQSAIIACKPGAAVLLLLADPVAGPKFAQSVRSGREVAVLLHRMAMLFSVGAERLSTAMHLRDKDCVDG